MLTVDPSHRLVEGVASDGSTIWVSSILDREILACQVRCRTLATLPDGIHPFAIAWDETRKRLWVAADCPPGVAGIKPCDRGALFALNRAGRMVVRIAPSSGSFHPGDVSAAPAGVFVSDGQNGAIYRVAKDGRSLTALAQPGTDKSGQGSVLAADARTLVVSDYGQGIATIDLASGAVTPAARRPDKPSLRGIDGMARCGQDYFAVYNGSLPGRLFSFRLGPDGLDYKDLVDGLRFPDPTQLAYDGKRLLIVADSGWATVDKAGFQRTTGATIVAIPLSRDCKPE